MPPALGYGADGAPPKVPPHTTLHFTIKLVRVGDDANAQAANAGARPEPTLRRRARCARGGARAHKKRANATKFFCRRVSFFSSKKSARDPLVGRRASRTPPAPRAPRAATPAAPPLPRTPPARRVHTT